MDGAANLGTGTLNGLGQATYVTSALAVGSHSVTAVYAGDPSFLSSTSAATSQAVNRAGTATALASATNPSVFGQSVTFTATVSAAAPGAGAPTGTVMFMDGAATLGTGTLNGLGQATYMTSALAVGSHSVTAVYAGDPSFLSSTSAATSQAVNQAGTATALASATNPSVFGQSVTFTATVSANAPGAGAPTGTVNFMDGAANLGTGTLNGLGQATYVTSALAVGSHSVTAVYAGDPSFLSSTSAATSQAVNQAGTATALASATNPSVFGQSVTFTATVSANAPGAGAPTGSVTFMDGAAILGTGALNGLDQATFTTAALGAATHSITAVYGGDASFLTSTSAATSQVVNQSTVSVNMSTLVNPSVYGQLITLNAAIVAVAPGAGIPTGSVGFYEGITFLGGGLLDASGNLSASLSNLSVGTHVIYAAYSGSTNFVGGSSTNTSQVVNQASSSTTVASSANPSVFGQSVTFTATVSPQFSGVATGTVMFMDGAATLGTGTLNGLGQATYTTSALIVGPHSVTVVYGGDSSFSGSTSAATTQAVNRDAVNASVSAAPNPGVYSQNVTFTAYVAAAGPGSGTPTGNVNFFDGATLLGSGVLDATDHATLSTSSLAVATHSITVSYAGDPHFQAGVSPTFNFVVGKAQTNTVISSATVNPTVYGQSVTFTAHVAAAAPSVGLPTGSVGFYDGSTLLGSAGLDNTGTAVFTTTTLPAGGHSITSVYGGDGNFQTSTSPVFVEGVSRASVSATFSGPGAQDSYGQTVNASTTVSAVAPGAGVPDGLVELLDGASVVATTSLDASGAAVFHVSSLSVGSHSLSIAYLGSAAFNPVNTSTIVQVVNQAPTATQLAASISSPVYGQPDTFTATVTGAFPGGSPPTGMVTFSDGSTTLGTAVLNAAGTAVFTTANLSVAQHSITATYVGDVNYLSGVSGASGVTVGQAATSAAVSGTLNPSVFGQSATIFVNVSTLAPGGGTPAGSVTLFDGATSLGSLPLSSGQGSFTTSALAAGAHSLSAVYNGDGSHQGTTSSVFVQSVSQATTALGLVSSAYPTVSGQSTTFTATLTVAAPGAGTPAGSVVFYDGVTPIGSAPLGVGGTAALADSNLGIGTHSITAVYAGSSNFAGTTSPVVSQSVSASSSTTLVASNTPTVYGQAVTLTANVAASAPGAGTPTGSVAFFDGATVLGTANLNGSGTASLLVALGTVGNHVITAVYAGTTAFSASTSSALTHVVNKAGVSGLLSSTVAAPVAGQSVTFIFTSLAVAPGAGLPTGGVTFTDGAATLGVATLSAGVATFTMSALAVGSHAVLASYSGDGNFNPVTTSAVNLSVAQEATTTALSAPLASSVSGQWLTYTATVSAVAPGGVVPAGIVNFFDGATLVASMAAVGGLASYTATNLTPGVHSFSASYLGGSRTLASASPTLALNVAKDNTVVSFTASAAVYGQATTVTAMLSAAPPGGGTPTNIVVFSDNGVQVGSSWVVNGKAQASLNLAPVGSTHSLTASYLGDPNFNSVNSTAVAVAVAKADTKTVLVSVAGSGGTYLVSGVAGLTPGSGVVGGSITFTVDGKALTSQSLVNGYAFTLLGSNGQNHTYTATYSGSSNFNPSTSPPLFLGSSAARAAASRPMSAFSARGSLKASGRPSSLFKF